MDYRWDDGCGGFGTFRSSEQMLKVYKIGEAGWEHWTGSYNIRPTAFAPIVIQKDQKREGILARFGLIPSWLKQSPYERGAGWINARSETVETKPVFRGAFRHKRALLPNDFFLEFALNPADEKHKVPILFKSKDDELLTMGAVWDTWKDVEGKDLNSFAILTTEPDDLVAKYHSRMPLLLKEEDFDTWLNPERDLQDLKKLMKPYPSNLLTAFRVKQEISNSRNDSPDLIEEQPPIPVLPSKPAYET